MYMQDYLVHPFRTESKYYVYDANTNLIASVSKEIYKFLTGSNLANDLREACLKAIENSRRETGLFSEFRPHGSRQFFQDDEIRYKINHELKHVTLKVTEGCNLRCSYCIYGGDYSGRPKHSNLMMPLEVAQKAIDYFMHHSDRFKGPLALGFYGGEPLLNFNTIQRATEYFKEQVGNTDHVLALTTNGTILSNRIIDFLVKNEIALTISIDGPQAVHDKYRVDIKGNGTFDKVMRNLNVLYNLAPEYVESMVRINVTLVPPVNFKILDAFFSNLPVRQFEVGLVELFGSKFQELAKLGITGSGYQDLRAKFINAAISGRLAKSPKPPELCFTDSLFGKAMKKIHQRGVFDRLPDWHTPGGLCTPGADKILVAPDGKFYVCEKVDGNDNMKIGDIDGGVNTEQVIRGIHLFYEFLGRECSNCWFSRLCPVCYAHCVHNHHLDPRKRRFNCNLLKAQYSEMMSIYCEIMEVNPKAFDFLS